MARVVPNAMGERLGFFKSHAPTWVANAASIGLTPAQAADVQDLTDEALAAHAAQVAAMSAAKSATLAYQSAMEKLTKAGTAAVATIKAYADASGSPDPVYSAALIALPKTPTRHSDLPLSPARAMKIAVGQDGVRVTWQADVADGRFFEVYRSLDNGPRALLSSVHGKTITDTTVPAGTEVVAYYVVAKKGSRRSQPHGTSLHLYGSALTSGSALRVA